MLSHIPLMLIPFVLYNIGLTGIIGADANPWDGELFSLSMVSGGVWSFTRGDLVMVIALVLLLVEIIKSTRTNNASIVDHMLSLGVLVLFIVEFLLVRGAATGLFFQLMFITAIDVLAGFSVSLRAASRDVNLR
jgi:hypothetical protein